jgi:site-specific DNA recombinase
MADRKLRCAIYTRKSTEDGLDQEFNSLDAQFEACSAYIISQRHEGWVQVTDRFDDGGFSGGNMERPAMKRLLAEVEAGRVDIILVYKVDRLTRSLSDFAKIVEVLDAKGASFVSITQAFNTTTSMGRLTLNVLLSFAQFEREVTGERIRDKIAASKKKGLWMGGPVPLGYDVQDRKLVVNEAEAELVRHIMRRYVALPSVNDLVIELDADGYRTKVQHRASGPHRGCVPFRRGTLYHLLSNRIYRGEIVHKGTSYPGEHPAIVPEELWNEVQETLKERASGESRRTRAAQPSLLTGLLSDGEGRSMTPSHATKSGRRYRYYVTRPDSLDGSPAWRVSAHDFEAIVCSKIAEQLSDKHWLHNHISEQALDAASLQAAFDAAGRASATLRYGATVERSKALGLMKVRIQLHQDRVNIELSRAGLMEQLGLSIGDDDETICISCDAVRVRKGHELRLIIPGANTTVVEPQRDEKLIALLAEAHAAHALITSRPGHSLQRIASDLGRCRTRLTKLFNVSLLAPDIVVAIVEGRQPASLSARSVMQVDLPLAWQDQRTALGFA